MKRILLLGSTGSIGESVLRVADQFPDRIEIAGLAVQSNYARCLEQAEKFNVRHVAVADVESARACRAQAQGRREVLEGMSGVCALTELEGVDLVVCAVVGMAGLLPVLASVEKGLDVALATKEVLVAAGRIVTQACARKGCRILPVDSEHSAVFQCLLGLPEAERRPPLDFGGGAWAAVRRLVLTASGGPFSARNSLDFDKVTVGEVLRHPTWNMGRKVTVDSATLMNKGLEIMEAHWLFGVPIDQIDVLIHPESIVHSMVETLDGNVLAQLSVPDMRFAIQTALLYPERLDGKLPQLRLEDLGKLRFQLPDEIRFPSLGLARSAARVGGTMPVVLNAANEVAVDSFLKGRRTFSGIWAAVEEVMQRHTVAVDSDLETILAADAWARREAAALCG